MSRQSVNLQDDQVKAEKRLSKPHLLILSPMCISLSRLQHAKPDELAKLREQGKRHLEFACSLARLQIEQGRHVLFEYHLAASEEPNLRKLRSTDGMRCVRCDQCQFGLTSVDDQGNVGPACKDTVFMTNDEYIAEAVNRRCFGGHDHIQLMSSRGESCEKYPPRLVAAILRALRQSMRAAGRGEAQTMLGKHLLVKTTAVTGPNVEMGDCLETRSGTSEASPQVLWVQEAVARRELTIAKVPGVENPADMGTKHLAQKEMHECLRRAGCHITGGRSQMAFRAAQET